MRKIMIPMVAAVVLLVLAAGEIHGQTPKQQPVGKPKSGKSQIVIEFVSFPDQLKRYEVYPWETLKVDDFQEAYTAMTQEGKFEDWAKSLTGTAQGKNRMIRVSRESFVLVVCCKPHMCDTSQIIVLYDPVKKKTYSILAVDGKFSWFGKPPGHIKDLLNVLLVEEFRAIYRGQV
jgi:hypothetical protein